MPKMKTNRAAAKRFRRTGTGKLKRAHAFARHHLGLKSRKRKRNLAMPRTKTVVPGRKRRRKVMTAVKGNRGGRRNLYQTARETLMRSLQFAYRDRRAKKRE